jgi:hypothetical protein
LNFEGSTSECQWTTHVRRADGSTSSQNGLTFGMWMWITCGSKRRSAREPQRELRRERREEEPQPHGARMQPRRIGLARGALVLVHEHLARRARALRCTRSRASMPR